MFALDLFNTDHERRLAEGAVDQLEQRRIDDLAMKMDDLVARARQANTPDAKAALMKEFQKCKSERDSYYKIRNETMGYGTLVGEETHEFKGAHGKLDVERTPGKTVVTRKEYPDSDEMRADRFPNRKLKGQGSGTAVKSGAGMSSSQGTMRKMPHLDHDSNDAPNYEVDEEVADQYNTKQVKVFKDKSGKPIGEIGFDLDASPGNDDWYCWHYATGYNVLGFDNAAEATKELRYVHKHPELVSETGIPGNVPAEQIPGKEDLLKGKGRQTYESQKKNSKEVNEGQRLHRGDPVVVTGPNEFEGKTGEIADFSPSGTFVIVDLYNHGKHSMHLSDIAYNEYADQEQDEEDDWYDDEDLDEGFQDFNKVEPYAVCLAGKPIKKFDYYEDARRFHDNWKQKLYREGNQAKADKITLLPLNLDEQNVDRNAQPEPSGVYKKNEFDIKEAEGRVDPILLKALKRMPDGLATHHQVLDAAYDAYAMELGYLSMKGNYGVTDVYIPKLMGLYKDKHGLTFNEGVGEGSWIAYDPKTKQIKKRFKTHTAGKSYAKVHGLGFASSEYYFDTVKEKSIDEAETDYSKRRQRERDVDAGKPVAKQRQSKMTDYQKKRAQDKKEMELGEESSTSSDDVERAILNRIMVAHTDLLMKFGPEKVMQAAEEVAYNVGDVDEIGTSDVSAYVAQVKQILGVPEELDEKWSQKYKSSINCSNPKGFSQQAHCDSKKK